MVLEPCPSTHGWWLAGWLDGRLDGWNDLGIHYRGGAVGGGAVDGGSIT